MRDKAQKRHNTEGGDTIADYIRADTTLPAYLPYPRFLLKMEISQTAKLLYALLLDRSTLSQKNGWQDGEGSRNKCGVQDIVVINQGALKGFVGIHPNWSGINAESIRSLCLSAYLPEEVVELNKMAEMRSGKKSDMALPSDYLTVSGTCFINQSSPVMTISKNGIRFSKACHTRLEGCEYVELLYHPILQVMILRKSNCDSSTAMHALSSSGHIINASRFLFGCKIGRTYLIPSKSRMQAILNFIMPYFMLTAGLFSMENWVRGGSS